MRRVRNLVLLVTMTAALPMSAAAADLKIIANQSVKASEISADELKAVFLATRTSLADGSEVTPVLTKNGSAHDALLAHLGKTDAALNTYYRSLVFTGKAPMPKSLASDAEVVEYVAKTKGAVGYIAAAASSGGAKTLTLK